MKYATDEPDHGRDGVTLDAKVVRGRQIVPVIVGNHEEVGHHHAPTNEGN